MVQGTLVYRPIRMSILPALGIKPGTHASVEFAVTTGP